jgi:RNA polymerase sigma-70 factor (TIGR02960 family)
VTDVELARARTGDDEAFARLTEPYRRELQLHCYRILGSLHDAEDVLQETLVAAWRGLDGFEARASLRTWLYRIATNRSLNLLRERRRRPVTDPGLPFPVPAPTRLSELTWLEPYPDLLLEGLPDSAPGPEARYERREAVGLAFLTALQRLPPRQRVVLVLRDVLGFRAGEVAELLDSSEAMVTSALQRARAALDARTPPARERALVPDSAQERALAGEFADAFERGDMDRVVSLLTEDAWLTMPPAPLEYQGRELVAEFLRHATTRQRARGRTVLLPTRANGQPAFGHYTFEAGAAVARGTGVLVLTLDGDRISVLSRFGGDDLVTRFGLPAQIGA